MLVDSILAVQLFKHLRVLLVPRVQQEYCLSQIYFRRINYLGTAHYLSVRGGQLQVEGGGSYEFPSVFIYCVNLHQFLILCSSKAMMFVKL